MRRGFVDTPDGQIHYRETGEGPAAIVLHPTALSAQAMIPFLEALGRRGLRAIGMDTMGYGDSDRPPEPYTTVEQFARQVVRLADGLGLARFHLIGAQTGAQIALQTAADYPDRVETLVLQEAFNWNTPNRRAVHERLHRTHPRTEDGSYLLEIWNRTRPRPRQHGRHQGPREPFPQPAAGERGRGRRGLRLDGLGGRRAVLHDPAGHLRRGGARPGADVRDLHPAARPPSRPAPLPRRHPAVEGEKEFKSFFREPEEAAEGVVAFIRNPGV